MYESGLRTKNARLSYLRVAFFVSFFPNHILSLYITLTKHQS